MGRFQLKEVWQPLRGLVLLGLWLLATGCGRKTESPALTPGLATQGSNPEAASTYADANLAQLTRDLRRWIVKTKQRPASFEEFAASAGVAVPEPPAGRKYVISKEMRVILADR